MAMIRCFECRKEMSNSAAACPHCGAPIAIAAQTKPTGIPKVVKWVGAFVLVLIAFRMCSSVTAPGDVTKTNHSAAASAPAQTTEKASPIDPAQLAEWMKIVENASEAPARRLGHANSIIEAAPNSPEAIKVRDLLPTLMADAEEEKTNGDWIYQSNEDAMTGKRAHLAVVRSDNTLDLDFPYQGEQRGTLTIRNHPKWGNDVIVSIEEGQILCHTYDCRVSIRFDDGQPITYTGNEPADNSSETVFLPYSISKKIKSARRVRVQLTLYNNGSQVLEFNVKGFDSDRMKG